MFRPLVLAALPALALALTAASAIAQPARWYTIELIVFEHLDDDGLHAEVWPQVPGAPPMDRAIELTFPIDAELAGEGPAAGLPHAFGLLPDTDLRLQGVWRALRRSRGYRPLLHVGWRQPGFTKGNARPAHITTLAIEAIEAGAPEGAVAPVPAPSPGPAPEGPELVELGPVLDGTLAFYRGRFLHVDADLLYRRTGAAVPIAGDPAIPAAFRLTESRRMKFFELHYLEHPLFGVLVEITPFELPEPEPIQTLPAEAPPPAADGEPAPKTN